MWGEKKHLLQCCNGAFGVSQHFQCEEHEWQGVQEGFDSIELSDCFRVLVLRKQRPSKRVD